METQEIINFIWPLIKQETGTAVTWSLIGAGLGLALSVILTTSLWLFFKNRKFLGGETSPRWPKCLLLISWIILIPLNSITNGAAWGAITAAHKISDNQKAIEKTVSLVMEPPINKIFLNSLESEQFSEKEKALLFNQQGDNITVSTSELNKRVNLVEEHLYDLVKEQALSFFSSPSKPNKDTSTALPQGLERWIIDTLLNSASKGYNPTTLTKKALAIIEHAEENFGPQISAQELGFSIGTISVKPETDKMVKSFKASIITSLFIQIAITVLISTALAAATVAIIKRTTHKQSK